MEAEITRVPSDMFSHMIQVAYAIPPTPEGVRARDDRGSYLMAFGPSCHCAGVVGQSSLGSRYFACAYCVPCPL